MEHPDPTVSPTLSVQSIQSSPALLSPATPELRPGEQFNNIPVPGSPNNWKQGLEWGYFLLSYKYIIISYSSRESIPWVLPVKSSSYASSTKVHILLCCLVHHNTPFLPLPELESLQWCCLIPKEQGTSCLISINFYPLWNMLATTIMLLLLNLCLHWLWLFFSNSYNRSSIIGV